MKKRVLLLASLAVVFVFMLVIAARAELTGDIAIKTITGQAPSQQVNISIFIGPSIPILNITRPENKTYIANYSRLLNFTAFSADNIWYNLDSGANITITSPVRFNTTEGSHTLYLYANNSNGLASTNVTFTINSSLFTVIYNEYQGPYQGSSMIFIDYAYEDMQDLSDIILENTLYGKIHFNQASNLPADSNFSDRTLDLDANTNISFNRIELNSTAIPNFNTSATIWLYNLTFTNPRILRDGYACPSSICTLESYSSGTLKFNVTGFTIYSAEESILPTPTPPGAGHPPIIKIKQLKLDKDRISIKLKQGEKKEEQVMLANTGNLKLHVNLSTDLEEFLTLGEASFDLDALSSKTLALKFAAKENAKPGLYREKLYIKGDGIEKEVLISVEVTTKVSLFDVKLEIPNKFLEFVPGENLTARITLYNLGIEPATVNLTYTLADEKGKTVFTYEEAKEVSAGELSFEKQFKLSADIPLGSYVLYAKLAYGEQVASSSMWFSVVRRIGLEPIILAIIIAIIIMLIILVLFYMRRKMQQIRKIRYKA